MSNNHHAAKGMIPAFLLTWMGMSVYAPLWYGGGTLKTINYDREPGDCLAADPVWLGRVRCEESMSETDPEAVGYVELTRGIGR